MKQNVALLAFNRGVISPLGLARVDVKKVEFSAETQTNWMPRVLGSMMFRPGTRYIGGIRSNLVNLCLPFIFAADDTAIPEITEGKLRVWVNDAVVTRPTVTAAVTNGTFAANITSWTDSSESGASVAWTASDSGCAEFTGTGFNYAILDQTITVNEPSTVHALSIEVKRGPITLRVGSTSGGDEYITETELGEGLHSLALTPTGNFYIRFQSRSAYKKRLGSCTIEGAGAMTITTPWIDDDLALIRWAQSADVIFLACDGYQQYKIERRGTESWSVVKYYADDGPFRLENLTPTTLAVSAITGDITVTASKDLFRSSHVGALFSIDSVGQYVSVSASTDDTFTSEIRVTGVETSRNVSVVVSGTWVGTVTLQRSANAPGSWVDVTSWTGNTSNTYNDELDNQIIYYRIGIKGGDYTSGTAVCSLEFAGGSITGIVRVTGYTNATTVSAQVLKSLGGTDASSIWSEGAWSTYRGFPSAVALYEGRLWFAGKTKIWGSVSDAYASFDESTEGDATAIARSIGSGPVDSISWLGPVARLLLGTASAVWSVKSSSFDEPLTVSAFNMKSVSGHGAKPITPAIVNNALLYAHRSGSRLYRMDFSSDSFDYSPDDLTVLAPEVCEPAIVQLGVQTTPDVRVHCVLSDGTVAILVFDPTEDVQCWVPYETDGDVEGVIVLPGTVEDSVYYTVKRTINGSDVRYLEKWALESECISGTINKTVDCHVHQTGLASNMTGLDHLIGETVSVWVDGQPHADCIVSATGEITLDGSYTERVAGLPYEATYKSSKLAYAASGGTALTQTKKVSHLGLILANTTRETLTFGPDFSTMDAMPAMEQGTTADSVYTSYDEGMIEFPGHWDTDARICLKAVSPGGCTILAGVIAIETSG